ncbi:neuronal pentraxin-2-like [Actinia tenebrosa]|uniref:Neuronal pentraxin-2-like n=1 Tax=Actinia tenebrosa TaxID=6105 RepID=A0A6P8IM70_ACTTE|nr:neuronal pentraxin-2-like [Actinia tenebrosa]
MNSTVKVFMIKWLTMILYAAATNAKCNSSSAIGYMLTGHVYRDFSAPEPLQCYSACKEEEPQCRSFNFHADKRICELNNHSKESRPSNFVPRDVTVYFHSCYRDGLGQTKALAANSCAEILEYEDSVGDGWYWIRTDPARNESAEIYCNMTNGGNMSSSFDLIFPTTRNTTNYAIIDTTIGTLSAFTVSLWLKTTEKILAPFSYAVPSQMNAILLIIDETGFLRFLVNNNQLDGQVRSLDDNAWHHVAATWESVTGHAQVFIDGVLTLNKASISLNTNIAAGGKIVLGQDQDTMGGGFDILQSFAGELTHVYLWDTVLSADVIAQMSRVCKEFPYPGHVVGWKDFDGSLHGEVLRRNLSRCKLEQA